MPAAQISFDFDSRKFFDLSGSQVREMSGKLDSIRIYELSITQNGVPMSLPAGTTVKVALKKTSDPAGTFLYSTTATRSGWGTGSRWYYTLNLTSIAFAALINTTVDFEILLEFTDSQHIPSLTVPFTIQPCVIVS